MTTSLFDGAAGLAGFDEACATEASAAGLAGSFLALVATSTQSALSRFDATGPRWVNMLGVPLADTAAALSVVTHLDAPPSFTAAGTPVSGSYWVGATLPSMVGDVTCADWTGATSGRMYGVEHTTGWFGGNPTNCAGTLHVVCFEE